MFDSLITLILSFCWCTMCSIERNTGLHLKVDFYFLIFLAVYDI